MATRNAVGTSRLLKPFASRVPRAQLGSRLGRGSAESAEDAKTRFSAGSAFSAFAPPLEAVLCQQPQRPGQDLELNGRRAHDLAIEHEGARGRGLDAHVRGALDADLGVEHVLALAQLGG